MILRRGLATDGVVAAPTSTASAQDHLDRAWHCQQLPPDCRWLHLAAPWRESLMQCRAELSAHKGQRVVVTCASAWIDGRWHDGPLAHVLPDGSVASYIPSGGPACLEIPDKLTPGLTGISWDEAMALDGLFEQRHLRCLEAELAARLPHGSLQLAAGSDDLRMVCLLAAIRKVRYEERLTISITAPSPSFRRFAQNTGLFLKEGSEGLPLSDFLGAIAPDEVGGLAQILNRLSPMIPETLLKR